MNIHRNARLSLTRRIELARMIVEQGQSRAETARAAGVSELTARKWLERYLAEGELGLHDRSSRPKRSPCTIAPEKAVAIVELRPRRLTLARIAASLALSESTVARLLRRAGRSRLSDLEPSKRVLRYEHERPGDLLHIDKRSSGALSASAMHYWRSPRRLHATADYSFVRTGIGFEFEVG